MTKKLILKHLLAALRFHKNIKETRMRTETFDLLSGFPFQLEPKGSIRGYPIIIDDNLKSYFEVIPCVP